jgi:hypothetical protein
MTRAELNVIEAAVNHEDAIQALAHAPVDWTERCMKGCREANVALERAISELHNENDGRWVRRD